MKARVIPKDLPMWRDSVPLKSALEEVASKFNVCWMTAYRWWNAGKLDLKVKWRSTTRVEIFKSSIPPAIEKLRNK